MRVPCLAAVGLALCLVSLTAQGQTAPVTVTYSGPVSFQVSAVNATVEHGDSYIKISWKPGPPPPVPPGPTPPNPPQPPPTPAPIPVAGLRVLIVYETDDLSKYPPAQADILYNPTLRTYLNSTTPVGSDGSTHEFRIWDKDVDATYDEPLWLGALKRPRASVPWIVISNGTTGYENILPGNVADTISLIKQFEVKSAAVGTNQRP